MAALSLGAAAPAPPLMVDARRSNIRLCGLVALGGLPYVSSVASSAASGSVWHLDIRKKLSMSGLLSWWEAPSASWRHVA